MRYSDLLEKYKNRLLIASDRLKYVVPNGSYDEKKDWYVKAYLQRASEITRAFSVELDRLHVDGHDREQTLVEYDQNVGIVMAAVNTWTPH